MENGCNNCSYHKVYLDAGDERSFCKCTYDVQDPEVGHAYSCNSIKGELSDCIHCDNEGQTTYNDDDEND